MWLAQAILAVWKYKNPKIRLVIRIRFVGAVYIARKERLELKALYPNVNPISGTALKLMLREAGQHNSNYQHTYIMLSFMV